MLSFFGNIFDRKPRIVDFLYLEVESCFIAGSIRISTTMHCTRVFALGGWGILAHIRKTPKISVQILDMSQAHAMLVDSEFFCYIGITIYIKWKPA